jgi:hypothetical protein
MAFDEKLAERVRVQIARKSGVAEKRMFGGVAFLMHGNMAIGIHQNELIVRMSPEQAVEALGETGARVFDLTGRPMKGWLMIGPRGHKTPESLRKWVGRGLDFASSLPKK